MKVYWEFINSEGAEEEKEKDLGVLPEGVGELSCWWITALKKRDVVICDMVITENTNVCLEYNLVW